MKKNHKRWLQSMNQPHVPSCVVTRARQCSQRLNRRRGIHGRYGILEPTSWPDAVPIRRRGSFVPPMPHQPESPASSRAGLNSSSNTVYIWKAYRKVLALNLDFLPSRMDCWGISNSVCKVLAQCLEHCTVTGNDYPLYSKLLYYIIPYCRGNLP